MKKFFLMAITAAFLMSPAFSFGAHLADFSRLTCEEFLAMGKNNTIPILFWLEGYSSARDGLKNMSEPHMEKTIYTVMGYCAANPKKSLQDALSSLTEH